MARHPGNLFLNRAFQRTLRAVTRSAVRTGTKVMAQALRAKPTKRPPSAPPKVTAKTGGSYAKDGRAGVAVSASGPRRYRLFKPTGVNRNEQLPLVVMLHGCGQDAQSLSASTRMNSVAERERFIVLYPEQDRLANAQGCWNWFDTRTGRAQLEADSVVAAISHVCLTQPIDRNRIAIAGLSSGAGMAALIATRHADRFKAVVMHSGIAPGVAHSTTTALRAMMGRRVVADSANKRANATRLPAMLVIQGSNDPIVAPSNGNEAARSWVASAGGVRNSAGKTRMVRRGTRYAMEITDYQVEGRILATLCAIVGLGHAWSGGAASQPFSDPKGPDASRMIWAFAAKQFAVVAP